MGATIQSDIVIAGGGLAGIVTALEALRSGKSVTIVDKDTPERFGGLALWAFGGMALVGTPQQQRLKIVDTPERAFADWIRFGEIAEHEHWPRAWARYYVEHSRTKVHDWLIAHGVTFMPAVNWVERGMHGEGNSAPRYHFVWGTSQFLTRTMIAAMRAADKGGRLRILHRHRVESIDHRGGAVAGAIAIDEESGAETRIAAPLVVLAMGGINGGHAEVRRNWPKSRPMPAAMLNGAHPFADGRLHRHATDRLGARITHAGEMWNYAAGFPHPAPHFPGHGLSAVPAKSALWLNHRGERIGPEPLVTGFDTHNLCQRVAAQEKPWTWQLMNWRIAAKEFAISGAEHNPRVRDRQMLRFMKETLLGNHRFIRQMQSESQHFLVDDTLAGLAAKMNALTATDDVKPGVLQATVDAFDANFANGGKLQNDDQIRRILHARQWGPDRLRTCKPAPLQKPGAGPYIAIQMQLITRKSLGGLQTDLQSRVLDAAGEPVPGLYCVGEAAGFGGGGASGKRSLEGTFLPGCILTGRAAAQAM